MLARPVLAASVLHLRFLTTMNADHRAERHASESAHRAEMKALRASDKDAHDTDRASRAREFEKLEEMGRSQVEHTAMLTRVVDSLERVVRNGHGE